MVMRIATLAKLASYSIILVYINCTRQPFIPLCFHIGKPRMTPAFTSSPIRFFWLGSPSSPIIAHREKGYKQTDCEQWNKQHTYYSHDFIQVSNIFISEVSWMNSLEKAYSLHSSQNTTEGSIV